jgi:hypothetical protein
MSEEAMKRAQESAERAAKDAPGLQEAYGG